MEKVYLNLLLLKLQALMLWRLQWIQILDFMAEVKHLLMQQFNHVKKMKYYFKISHIVRQCLQSRDMQKLSKTEFREI
jgi:hypothetical protein